MTASPPSGCARACPSSRADRASAEDLVFEHQRIGEELGGPVRVLPGVIGAVDGMGTLDAAALVRVARQLLGGLEEAVPAPRRLAVLVLAGDLVEPRPVD